jgi:hypothetical protein
VKHKRYGGERDPRTVRVLSATRTDTGGGRLLLICLTCSFTRQLKVWHQVSLSILPNKEELHFFIAWLCLL